MTAAWSRPAPGVTVYHRASGRRAYNALRRDQAEIRRIEICEYLEDHPGVMLARGRQRQLAAHFGVSNSTMCRDMRVVTRRMHGCPTCGVLLHIIDDEDDDND